MDISSSMSKGVFQPLSLRAKAYISPVPDLGEVTLGSVMVTAFRQTGVTFRYFTHTVVRQRSLPSHKTEAGKTSTYTTASSVKLLQLPGAM